MQAMLARDASYDGIFYVAVRTTGIFCRPTCPARKPLPENVEFFRATGEALHAGYRPCQRCRPMEPDGQPPAFARQALELVEAAPSRRLTDDELRGHGIDPERLRRWFRQAHGMTFQAYARSRRLGTALGRLQDGEALVDTAYDHGFESLSGFREALRRWAGKTAGQARQAERLWLARLSTPLGVMVAGATEERLVLLEFADRRSFERELDEVARRCNAALVPGPNPLLAQLEEELGQYFAGERRHFTVAVAMLGTPFQVAAWEELQRIPYGTTRSYAEQARRLGRPEAVRAVALANGANRIAVVIPCHRVVGADGRLRGYGGGVWRKQRLLELESAGTAPREAS